MIKFFSPCVSFLLILASGYALSAEQCPAIDCDCTSIESDKWKSACQQHEARIKTACVANRNTPKDYCSIHGPDAKPLPLAIEFSEFTLDGTANIDELAEKVESLYWFIAADTDAAIETFNAGNYARTMQILKLIDSKIINLFQHQEKLEAAYIAQEEEKRVSGSWKKSANEVLKLAKKIEAFGSEMAAGIARAKSAKEKKIFTVLSKKAIRMAGLGFEHAGYAYGRSGRHKDAAKTWSLAADTSEKLLAIDRSTGAKKEAMKFTELQAAARMHRKSYHFMVNNKVDAAVDALKASQTFVNRQEQQFIGDLVDSLESGDSEEGVLSGR